MLPSSACWYIFNCFFSCIHRLLEEDAGAKCVPWRYQKYYYACTFLRDTSRFKGKIVSMYTFCPVFGHLIDFCPELQWDMQWGNPSPYASLPLLNSTEKNQVDQVFSFLSLFSLVIIAVSNLMEGVKF